MQRGTTRHHFKIFALWHKLARRSAAGGRRPSCQVVSEWIFWNDVWWFPSASMRNIYIYIYIICCSYLMMLLRGKGMLACLLVPAAASCSLLLFAAACLLPAAAWIPKFPYFFWFIPKFQNFQNFFAIFQNFKISIISLLYSKIPKFPKFLCYIPKIHNSIICLTSPWDPFAKFQNSIIFWSYSKFQNFHNFFGPLIPVVTKIVPTSLEFGRCFKHIFQIPWNGTY